VVGETPYAEGVGDVGGPQWGYDPGDHGVLRPPQTMQLNAADKAAVDKVCSQATNCVVIVVSGRPIIFDPAQLPVTWPRTLDQEPINVGDANYDPLYPFAFGLQTR
jgi:beta-glucosidase